MNKITQKELIKEISFAIFNGYDMSYDPQAIIERVKELTTREKNLDALNSQIDMIKRFFK